MRVQQIDHGESENQDPETLETVLKALGLKNWKKN